MARPHKQIEGRYREYGADAATLHERGAIAVLLATGMVTPGDEGAAFNGLRAMGVATGEVGNQLGAAGDKRVRVESGIFCFANSAGADEITLADTGSDCFVVDDETVALTSNTNTRAIAGKIWHVDAMGVWVRMGE